MDVQTKCVVRMEPRVLSVGRISTRFFEINLIQKKMLPKVLSKSMIFFIYEFKASLEFDKLLEYFLKTKTIEGR